MSKNLLPHLKRATIELKEARARLRVLEDREAEPIAIVGAGLPLSGRRSNPPRTFWQLSLRRDRRDFLLSRGSGMGLTAAAPPLTLASVVPS